MKSPDWQKIHLELNNTQTSLSGRVPTLTELQVDSLF